MQKKHKIEGNAFYVLWVFFVILEAFYLHFSTAGCFCAFYYVRKKTHKQVGLRCYCYCHHASMHRKCKRQQSCVGLLAVTVSIKSSLLAHYLNTMKHECATVAPMYNGAQ